MQLMSYPVKFFQYETDRDILPKLCNWKISLDSEIPSSPDTLHVYLYHLDHSLGIRAFKPIWPCLIVKILAIQEKFLELSSYNITFHPTDFFGQFSGIMAQFELIKYKFPS